jgi:hypothetical protein
LIWKVGLFFNVIDHSEIILTMFAYKNYRPGEKDYSNRDLIMVFAATFWLTMIYMAW